MEKLTAVIVDDERLARKELIFLLKSHKEVEVVGEAESIKDAVSIIQNVKPDLVFLDIQLAGENGFDLIERIDVAVKFIFVTAYDQYAIKAFEVNASDYLLKPVDPERLKLTLKRILVNGNRTKIKRKFEYNDSLYVKLNNNSAKFIKLYTIVVISSLGNYTKLKTNDGKSYTVLKSIKQWEEELPEKRFIRIHRSTIVNMEYISRLERFSATCLKIFMLNINEPMEVSRSYSSKIKNISTLK